MFVAVVAVLALITPATSFYDALAGDLLPCPTVHPQADIDVDNLLGPWHLSLVVMDAIEQDFIETVMCVSAEYQRYNQSTMRQVWTLQTLQGEQPVIKVDLPTTVVRPGVWSIHSPFGDLKAVVFESNPHAYMLASYCGWYKGVLVHLWTYAVTRSRVLSPTMHNFITSALEDHGFNSLHSKIITLHGC